MFNAIRLLEWSDPSLLSDLHFGSLDQWRKKAVLQPTARSVQPLSDNPEGHLGFPWSFLGSHGVIFPLIGLAVHYYCGSSQPWLTSEFASHEATWPSWVPLLMRLDTGVPVSALWCCRRATSRAMVAIDSMYSVIL